LKCAITSDHSTILLNIKVIFASFPRKQLDKLIAADFIEFGSSGKIYYKKDSKQLSEISPNSKITDFAIKKLSSTVILATYKIIINNLVTLRSSIWQKNNNNWQIIFHQGTKQEYN
ncbi:MAG: hypothetical protein HRU35_07515, partial [Rickettsiaceae bacterium]|nr:hypothetical protein [Rickettsiaceae bacterium]